MSGVGTARSRAIAVSRANSDRLVRMFVAAVSATLLSLGAAFGLAGQDVEVEKPKQEMAMGSVSINTPVTVVVRNHNWLDARIYAVHAGTRYRLGTVNSFQTESFELPRVLQPHTSAVQLLTLPIGSTRGYLSPEVYAEPGDVLAFQLEENLNLSSLYVAGTTVANR